MCQFCGCRWQTPSEVVPNPWLGQRDRVLWPQPKSGSCICRWEHQLHRSSLCRSGYGQSENKPCCVPQNCIYRASYLSFTSFSCIVEYFFFFRFFLQPLQMWNWLTICRLYKYRYLLDSSHRLIFSWCSCYLPWGAFSDISQKATILTCLSFFLDL